MNAEKKKIKGNMILLIHGNERDRTNLSSRLRVLNYSIEAPLAGFHALHLCERNHYDVVLIASDMEDMPGIEIASLIRTQKQLDNLPIIYISPDDEKLTPTQILEFGINEYISQPYTFNNIVEKLNALL